MGGRASAGKEFAVVVKEHDSIAEQAPALFGVSGYRAGGVPVRCRRGWARREMVACPGSGGGYAGRRPLWAG
jgi:hypothetical protein